MPDLVWEPSGPLNHTIPKEWDNLAIGTIIMCDCGRLGIHDTDDYGKPVWRHLRRSERWFYRIFAPERIGMATENTLIRRRNDV